MDAWDALNATTLHVLPTDDLIGHTTEGNDCLCGPDTELIETDDGDRWLITHHSLDGREAIPEKNLDECRDYFREDGAV